MDWNGSRGSLMQPAICFHTFPVSKYKVAVSVESAAASHGVESASSKRSAGPSASCSIASVGDNVCAGTLMPWLTSVGGAGNARTGQAATLTPPINLGESGSRSRPGGQYTYCRANCVAWS